MCVYLCILMLQLIKVQVFLFRFLCSINLDFAVAQHSWPTHAKISFKLGVTPALNGVLIEGRRSWPHPQLPVDARALQ